MDLLLLGCRVDVVSVLEEADWNFREHLLVPVKELVSMCYFFADF